MPERKTRFEGEGGEEGNSGEFRKTSRVEGGKGIEVAEVRRVEGGASKKCPVRTKMRHGLPLPLQKSEND